MVHQRGLGLPQRRAELYDECTDLLLGYWDQTKGGEAARELAAYGELTRSEKRSLLEPVALWFHERGDAGTEADKNELQNQIARQFQEMFADDKRMAHRRAELFLKIIDERAGLLVEREAGTYAFAHLTFQEYLAARAIADRDDYIAYTIRHLNDPWWREVILLEVGHLSDGRHFKRRARKLTTDLLASIQHTGGEVEKVLRHNLLLAARSLCDIGKLGIEDSLRQSIIDELMAVWRYTPYELQQREIINILAYAAPTIDWPQILSSILKCLASRDSILRARTLEALRYIDPRVANQSLIDTVLKLTYDPIDDVRVEAAHTLITIGGSAIGALIVGRLLEMLSDKDPDVRSVVIQGLVGLSNVVKEIITKDELLAAIAYHKRREMPNAILWRFIQVESTEEDAKEAYPFEEEGDEEDLIERLLSQTSDYYDPMERSVALLSIGDIGESAESLDVIEQLLDSTFDGNDLVCHSAVTALGEMGENAATEEVVERLLDLASQDTEIIEEDDFIQEEYGQTYDEYLIAIKNRVAIRHAAIHALGQLGDSIATEETIRALHSLINDPDLTIVREVSYALIEIGGSAAAFEVEKRLLTIAASEDEFIRITAMDILQHIKEISAETGATKHVPTLSPGVGESSHYSLTWVLAWMGKADITLEVVEQLVSLTADVNEDLRYAALLALGEMGKSAASQEVMERLLVLTNDTDKRVRFAAAWALGALADSEVDPEMLERLIKLTSDVDYRVRYVALQALGEIGVSAAEPHVVERLLQLTRDKNPNIRAEAVWALGEISRPVATPYLVEQLLSLTYDVSSEVRTSLVYAIGKIGSSVATRSVVEALVSLSEDTNAQVRLASAWAFTQIGKAAAIEDIMEALIKLADDPRVDVSCEALRALGEMGEGATTPTVVAKLLHLIFDEDAKVRATVAQTLGCLSNSAHTSQTIEQLAMLCSDIDEEVRYSAAFAFSRINHVALSDEVIEKLSRLTADGSEKVRVAAALAISRMEGLTPTSNALDRLVNLWNDRLNNTEFEFSYSGRYRRVCDVAYEELLIITNQFASS